MAQLDIFILNGAEYLQEVQYLVLTVARSAASRPLWESFWNRVTSENRYQILYSKENYSLPNGIQKSHLFFKLIDF